MSAKISGLVWEADLPREQKYLLLALADHAKHDGSDVYPSVALLCWKTDYSRRQVQRLMRALEQHGILVPVGNTLGGAGRSTEYLIAIDAIPLKEPYRKGDILTPFSAPERVTFHRAKGRHSTGEKGVIAMTPEPIEPNSNQLPPTPLTRGVRITHRELKNLSRHREALVGARVGTGECERHPQSGRTIWGTCWGCYEEELA